MARLGGFAVWRPERIKSCAVTAPAVWRYWPRSLPKQLRQLRKFRRYSTWLSGQSTKTRNHASKKKSPALIGDGGRGFCAWTAVCARPDESLSGNRIREVKGSKDQGGGKRAWLRDLDEKTLFRDGHHRMNDRVVGLCVREKLGRSAMKTLLAGTAFAIGIVFASQAFALPCPKGMWQGGHYVCADFDE
jgi:hypothetical protein